MGVIEVFLIGVGLSMDAFAVSIAKGLSMEKINKRYMILIALFFGGFQAIMPLTGYFLGYNFADKIKAVDHWIAFVLLLFIGGKMAIDAIKEMKEERSGSDETVEKVAASDIKIDIPELFILAIATSIDALAVGVTFSFLNVNIWSSIAIIGCTTFIISIAGVVIGNIFGAKYKSRAEILGGLILMGIGIKILIEHLMQ